jgi:hypothetical protein
MSDINEKWWLLSLDDLLDIQTMAVSGSKSGLIMNELVKRWFYGKYAQ